MSLRIWLKDGAEEELEDIRIEVSTDVSTGKKYISPTCGDILDPALKLRHIPNELIEDFTMQTDIHCGFRLDGIYIREDATLMVKTIVVSTGKKQMISASAPTLGQLKGIYRLLRCNMLEPVEKWGVDNKDIKGADGDKNAQ